jgi:hypothetical protein
MMTIGVLWTFLFSPFQHLRFTIPATGCILMNGYYDWLYASRQEDEEEEDDDDTTLPENKEEEHLMLN